MKQSKLVDLIGLFHTDKDIPSVLFPVRKYGSTESLRLAVGNAIVDRFISFPGEGVPLHRPGYRVEAIEPNRLSVLAESLGVIATQPDDIIEELKLKAEIDVQEVNDIGYE